MLEVFSSLSSRGLLRKGDPIFPRLWSIGLGGAKNLIYFEGTSSAAAVVFQKGHGNAINHLPIVWLRQNLHFSSRLNTTVKGFVFNRNQTVEKICSWKLTAM